MTDPIAAPDGDGAEQRRRLLKLLLAEEGIAVAPEAGIPRRPAGAEVPLSFAQRRLWLTQMFDTASPLYNMAAALRLSGPLSPPALEAAFRAIQRRHEVLRTTFALLTADDVPVQVISPRVDLSLPCVDLRRLPDPQDEARRLAAEERRRPFDLRYGPLLRVTLVRLEEREWLLLFSLHHIVSDGWSIGILLRELGEGYRSVLSGIPPRWPALPIQYADFAVWERRRLQGEALAEALRPWRRRLAGVSAVLPLPFDRPRDESSQGEPEEASLLLPADLIRSLSSVGRREGATLFMVLLTGFAVAMGRFAGRDDIVLGSNVANRNLAATQGLIGFFVNLLPLRVELSRATLLRGLLAHVRDVIMEAHAHQEVPFDLLLRELGIERAPATPPLVQVLLDLQEVPRAPLDLPGIVVGPFGGRGKVAPKLTLDLLLTHREQGLHCALRYTSDLFHPATMARLLDAFRLCLACAAEDADLPLAEVEHRLSEHARQQDLATWEAAKRLRWRRLRQASLEAGDPLGG